MVSLWPWKRDDNSPASFEKILSTLSGKIGRMASRLDNLRQRTRRFNVLWTLYAGFAYLLYTIILVLVVGWRNWGLVEYSAVAAGPVMIYLGRLCVSTYYNHRISSILGQLNELQSQRDETIEKLKTATKYDSTQELLKKYGGTPSPKDKQTKGTDSKDALRKGALDIQKVARTGVPPPPTANIQRGNVLASPQTTPQHSLPQIRTPFALEGHRDSAIQTNASPTSPQEEFAPNAFVNVPQYASTNEGSRWYDRLMDVLLGEDENRPGARIALICSKCRLVNGQAPPGIPRLEDLGKWRCASCDTINGEETEAKKIVASVTEQAANDRHFSDQEEKDGLTARNRSKPRHAGVSARDNESDVTQSSDESPDVEPQLEENQEVLRSTEEFDTPKRRSTRPKRGPQKLN